MSDNITVVPWGLHPMSGWVVDELKRRSNEYGQNPFPTEEKPYSGPRTAWVRFFSNGKSKMPGAMTKEGFVLGGTHGFSNSYGFNETNTITIGVDAYGDPHNIPNDRANVIVAGNQNATRTDFPHRPPPSVDSISCELFGASSSFPNLCRKIIVNWRCFSLAQLNYLAPYFLTPRVTCLVEWGWNNYDNASLVDLTDLDWLNKMFTDPSYTTTWIEESNGNYDAGIGFITDYSFKMNEAGGYDCMTTITNANKLIEGEQIQEKTTSKKQGNQETPVQSFVNFIQKNLESIDSEKESYKNIRKTYKLETDTTPIKNRVFRISDADIKYNSKNKKGFWLRMDLVQDIVNAFFKAKMKNPQTATIREWDISETILCGHPFLKSSTRNILIPNQFAPRLVYENAATETKTGGAPTIDSNTYQSLFSSGIRDINQEYGTMRPFFDNLKEAINPYGNSFPMYEIGESKDARGNTVQSYKTGYWGYLTDIFISAEFLKDIVNRNDSMQKVIEQLLQGINDAFCQICQLKLISAEYGNSKYSVYDENLPGVSSGADASKLPKITLGSIDSAFIKSVSFDVKISAEMMNQLVFQSANPDNDADGSLRVKNTKATPISSRYADGDRLYELGIIETTLESTEGPGVTEDREAIEAQQKAAAEELNKRKKSREESQFEIFYKNGKKYFYYEPTKDFLNYVLAKKDKSAPYQNNAIMPGTTLTMELLGISGIDYLSQFVIDHAPEAYNYNNAVWQVSDIKQSVDDKNWTTTIVAQVRPLTVL